MLKITYSDFGSKYDEWIEQGSHRILEQYTQGGCLKLNNRTDVLDLKKNKWREARIVEMSKDFVKIHYKGYSAKFDEVIESKHYQDRIKSVQEGLSKKQAKGPKKKKVEV